jgi:hypothetical protein
MTVEGHRATVDEEADAVGATKGRRLAAYADLLFVIHLEVFKGPATQICTL